MKFLESHKNITGKLLPVLLILILSLSGCATNGNNTANSSEATEEIEVKEKPPVHLDVVVYKYSEDTNGLWLGPEGIKAGLKNEYPNIELNLHVLPWEEAFSYVNNDLLNDNEVDLFLTDDIDFYLKKDKIAPVSEFIPENIKDGFHPLVNTEYGIPFAALRRMLFLNNDLVYGLDSNATLTRDYGGFLEGLRAIKANRPDIVPLGLDFSDEGGFKTYLSLFNTIGDKDAVYANFQIMKNEGLLGENPKDADLNQNFENFENGQTAMIFAPENYFKKPFGFSASMLSLPGNSGVFVYDSFAVTKEAIADSDKKEAIKDFFYYLYGPIYEKYLEIEGFSNVYLDSLGEYKPYPTKGEVDESYIKEIVFEQKNILK